MQIECSQHGMPPINVTAIKSDTQFLYVSWRSTAATLLDSNFNTSSPQKSQSTKSVDQGDHERWQSQAAQPDR